MQLSHFSHSDLNNNNFTHSIHEVFSVHRDFESQTKHLKKRVVITKQSIRGERNSTYILPFFPSPLTLKELYNNFINFCYKNCCLRLQLISKHLLFSLTRFFYNINQELQCDYTGKERTMTAYVNIPVTNLHEWAQIKKNFKKNGRNAS